jgi:hypothetical protein
LEAEVAPDDLLILPGPPDSFAVEGVLLALPPLLQEPYAVRAFALFSCLA